MRCVIGAWSCLLGYRVSEQLSAAGTNAVERQSERQMESAMSDERRRAWQGRAASPPTSLALATPLKTI